MEEDQHLNTFEKYANLFGAGIPVTLSEAVKKDVFKKGDLICLVALPMLVTLAVLLYLDGNQKGTFYGFFQQGSLSGFA